MSSNIYINLDKEHPLQKRLESAGKAFAKVHPDRLVFGMYKPLNADNNEEYDYKFGAVLLSPGHKIVFVGIEENNDFLTYVDDFIDDLGTLSKNYNYQQYIGRPRSWEKRITTTEPVGNEGSIDLERLIGDGVNEVEAADRRLIKYLISLLTGSINKLDGDPLRADENILDAIRNKIVLFDADQTRFLYTDYHVKKLISVQGLSGTGKTELLLHKLTDIFSKSTDDNRSKVYFTCHNIALANELRERIPGFFNKMRITRQIAWQEELWVGHAWGSHRNADSGLYAFLCHHYNLPFYSFMAGRSYEFTYSQLLKGLESIPSRSFKPCLDYILVDENQDFPEVFFDVCKKVVREKVYTAGDVFQNIFYQKQDKPKGFDISLNRCYRTDPRTLMFAHTLGLGLKEPERYNWFSNDDWESFGYTVEKNRDTDTINLKRTPINRFEGDDPLESVVISAGTDITSVCNILRKLQSDFSTLKAGDVAIIMIDDDREIYGYMDTLALAINKQLGWKVRRGYEIKKTDPDRLYLTNTNNVKGLEFPFVICVTARLRNDINYRNKLYTMLTRSFLMTYLLFKEGDKVGMVSDIYRDINDCRYIRNVPIPTDEEREKIAHSLLEKSKERERPWDEIVTEIFVAQKVDKDKWESLKKMLLASSVEKFDIAAIERFVKSNKEFV